MKKVVVMTTGGTIAMKYDPVTQGLIPAVSGDDLIEAVPALREIAEVEVVEFSNVPSGHITPQMMFDLAKMADRYAEREDVSGIVVTHGTDTLEETASLSARRGVPPSAPSWRPSRSARKTWPMSSSLRPVRATPLPSSPTASPTGR